MQELRFVLIIVGALAIAALLFHGLWTSKKEGSTRFGNKPMRKVNVENDKEPKLTPEEKDVAPEDDFEVIRKERKEPEFAVEAVMADPLIDNYPEDVEVKSDTHVNEQLEPKAPSINKQTFDKIDEPLEPPINVEPVVEPKIEEPIVNFEPEIEPVAQQVMNEPQPEPEMQVIVLNVHCAGDEPFIGTRLFDSMQQHGLLYGEMDIFHRHSDLSGTGRVLFSVANMMQPGTLKHDDPAEFSTKGISFFMTLPCFGEPDQNFKLMLKTAQQIADDLGANVLDDSRNLMTPNRIDAYKAQIQTFKAASV